MIYLWTGQPGEGKTLLAIKWVHDKAQKEGRPVFYARIKGIREAGVLQWQMIDPFKWYECPANAIVLLDEVQHSENPEDPKSPVLFGVRKRGDPVPLWAQKLETHRHLGIDLVLISQDPMLLDAHDRKLIGTHFHVVRTFGMQRATVYEYKGVRPTVSQSRAGFVARHEHQYPKEVYNWYKSAEAHTHKARIPMRFWLLIAMPFVIGGIGWAAWHYYLDPSAKKSPESQPGKPGALLPAQAPGMGSHAKLSKEDYLKQQVPRVPGLAYTAPVYDDVTKPVQAPYPAGCVVNESQTAKPCTCYTQQGTKLQMSDELCKSIVNSGFFVTWAQPNQTPPAPVQKPVAVAESKPGLVSLGGGRPMGPAGSGQQKVP